MTVSKCKNNISGKRKDKFSFERQQVKRRSKSSLRVKRRGVDISKIREGQTQRRIRRFKERAGFFKGSAS